MYRGESTIQGIQGVRVFHGAPARCGTHATQLGGLDLLVNNAGVGAIGPFHHADEQRLRRVMEVNFFAPVELIRDTLRLLRAGQQPMIVNVSSVLGHRAVPKKTEYCASKFALHGFSDSLRAELARFEVDVLLVSPSTTATEFFDSVLEETSRKTGETTYQHQMLGAQDQVEVIREAAEGQQIDASHSGRWWS